MCANLSDSAVDQSLHEDALVNEDVCDTETPGHEVRDNQDGVSLGDGEHVNGDEDPGPKWDADDDGTTEDDASSSGSESEDEWEDDEYPPLDLNYEALKHIATYYLPGNHGKCVDVKTLTRGAYHEIRVLHFRDGWTCIGRFTRCDEHLDKTESELATIEYVRKHSTIRVPETYFVNFNPNHAVGAAFVLMELLPGKNIGHFWEDLSTEHKKGVVEQIADVLGQMANMKFDTIGCLKMDGSIGPLLLQELKGIPSTTYKTTEEYMLSTRPISSDCTKEMNELNLEFKSELLKTLHQYEHHLVLSSPFGLVHEDFDSQNMLFIYNDRSQPPQLSGIIDWDYSHTGPLYQLLDYPIFIQDVDWSPELYHENKILRKLMVQRLAEKFPKGSKERRAIKDCFRMKCWILQSFQRMWVKEDRENKLRLAKEALEEVREGVALAYEGKLDYEPDSEPESDDES